MSAPSDRGEELTVSWLFRHPMKGRVVYNIGGIANPRVIRAEAAIEGVFAFDSGPGNMIVDGLVVLMTDGRKTHDADGAIAATGTVNRDLLAAHRRVLCGDITPARPG